MLKLRFRGRICKKTKRFNSSIKICSRMVVPLFVESMGLTLYEAYTKFRAKNVAIKKELDSVSIIANNIVNLYQKRLQAFELREKVINSVNYDFSKVTGHFYVKLLRIFNIEKQILDAIESEEKDIGTLFTEMIRQLELNKDQLQQLIDKRWKGFFRRISVKHLEKFIVSSVKFLRIVEGDVENLKYRISLEEQFLQARNRESFTTFIGAWEAEKRAIQESKKHFDVLLDENRKVFKNRHYGKVVLAAGFTAFILTIAKNDSQDINNGLAALLFLFTPAVAFWVGVANVQRTMLNISMSHYKRLEDNVRRLQKENIKNRA